MIIPYIYVNKVVLFFWFGDFWYNKTEIKAKQLWPLGVAAVLTLETQDQVHSAPLARDYHYIHPCLNHLEFTCPIAHCNLSVWEDPLTFSIIF